jgi:hypothetical protein
MFQKRLTNPNFRRPKLCSVVNSFNKEAALAVSKEALSTQEKQNTCKIAGVLRSQFLLWLPLFNFQEDAVKVQNSMRS